MGKIMSNKKLNGSVTALAKAFQNVISDVVKTIETQMNVLNVRIDGIDEKINTTNENMQSQFSQQEEKMASNSKKIDNQFVEMGKRFDNIGNLGLIN